MNEYKKFKKLNKIAVKEKNINNFEFDIYDSLNERMFRIEFFRGLSQSIIPEKFKFDIYELDKQVTFYNLLFKSITFNKSDYPKLSLLKIFKCIKLKVEALKK